jgi:hypothetical protein
MLVEKTHAERKLAIDGGNGPGPARQPKTISKARKPRKPRDMLVDNLVVEVDEPKKGSGGKWQVAVYCIGCKKRTAGQDPNCIKQHAKDCTVSHWEKVACSIVHNKKIQALSKDFLKLYGDGIKNLAKHAHSTKLGTVNTALEASTAPEVSDIEILPEIAWPPAGTIMNYMNSAKISEQHRMKIEWLMFQMFICCTLPWALLNNNFFVEFVSALAPSFIIPDRSAFFPKHLAQEVTAWGEAFKEFIKNHSHLTLSFDGWSTKACDELYTFHTTTPKWRSFFTDGHVFKGESVTGEALLSIIIKV